MSSISPLGALVPATASVPRAAAAPPLLASAPAVIIALSSASAAPVPLIEQPGFSKLPVTTQRQGVMAFVMDYFTMRPGQTTMTEAQFLATVKPLVGTTSAQALWKRLNHLGRSDGHGHEYVTMDDLAHDLANGHVLRDVFGMLMGLDQGGAESRAVFLIAASQRVPMKEAGGFFDWLGGTGAAGITAHDLDRAFGTLGNDPRTLPPLLAEIEGGQLKPVV